MSVQRLCGAVLRALGVRHCSRGAPAAPGTLVLANHLSWLDIVVLLAQRRLAFVAKNEVKSWPIVGALADRIGVVFIDRTRKRDLLRAIPVLEQRLQAGYCVVLFPEGTTTNGNRMAPFKSALVEAAVRARAPVQPAVLRANAYANPEALCWIDDESLAANLPRVWRTPGAQFEVTWLPPLAPCGDRKLMTRNARAQMEAALQDGALQQCTPTAKDSSQRLTASRRVGLMLLRSVAGFVLAVLVMSGLLYMQAPRYDFAPADAFRGTQWYNPYDAHATRGHIWWRTNLHSHARAWGGMTAGRQQAPDVVEHYRSLGTQVIGLSDYHADPASRPAGTLPVYEHGWNVAKSHRLAIGASSVMWFDFPLWGSAHEEQYTIDRLHERCELVAIAHPGLRHGHTPGSLSKLSNFELLEVLNHFLPPADSAWDAALSAGRPVWLLASDDSHDITGSGETGANFTRVLATDTSGNAIIRALREGRAYGVRTRDHRGSLHLQSLVMHHDTLLVRISGRVRHVRVIGQHGAVRRTWDRGTSQDTAVTLSATALHEDGYLRVVAEGPDEWLYSNPVVRWNGHVLPAGLATVNAPRTVLRQTAWRLAYAWLALWWIARLPIRPRARSKRPTRPAFS